MTTGGAPRKNVRDIHVIAPNFKRRLSGVTSTIVQLVPLQAKTLKIATLGPGLPAHLPKIRFRDLPALRIAPGDRPFRIWHARRNIEMLPGIILRDVLRFPVKLVFTSASQRRHTAYTRWLISRMDAVIATSAKTAAYLRRPSSVVMHGVDLDRFCPPPNRTEALAGIGFAVDRKLIGCFGRIRRQKGTDRFVESMIALLPHRPDWTAIIAGRTTPGHQAFEAGLRASIASAGLTERILFVGEHRDIERWYKGLALFVAPQRWEGFGLTPIEAMACGVPVVATDVGVFSEIVTDGVTGTIVPPEDRAAMTVAIARLMDDAAARTSMGEAAVADMRRRFALQREVDEIADVYGQLWSSAENSAQSTLTRR